MANSITITSSSTYSGRTMKLVCTQRIDIASNKSYIDWTLSTQGGSAGYWYTTGPTTVTINGVQVYYSARVSSSAFPSGVGSTSGTIEVPHSNDGSKTITVSLKTAIYYASVQTNSQSWTLDTIPRQATLSSAPNFNDEGNPSITYSNPAGTAVSSLQACISLTGAKDDVAYRDINKTGTSYTFNLTTAERDVLRSASANSNTLAVKFYVKTIIGGTTFYSILDRTMTIVNATPTVTSATAVDVNNTTIALTGSSGTIVKGHSNLKVSGVTASAVKKASLKNILVDDASETWSSTYAKTINKYTKNNVAIKVVDSRSNTSSAYTKTLGFVNYFDITKGNISVSRANSGVGEGVTLVLNGTWFNGSFGAVTNTLAVTYRFKETSASSWTTGATTLNVTKSGNNFSVNQAIKGDLSTGFNIEKSYNLEVIFTDKLSTATFSVVVSSGSPAISITGNKIALGGKFDSSLGLDVQFKKCPFPIGYIYMSVSSDNPNKYFGGTWEQIKDRFLLACGSSYSAGATGGASKHTHSTGNHTLTTAEIPWHTHGSKSLVGGVQFRTMNGGSNIVAAKSGICSWANNSGDSWAYGVQSVAGNNKKTDVVTVNATHTHDAVGGSGAHNHGNTGETSNLPPYIAVYIWKRTK